jgi:hypothetical protein
MCNIDLKKKYEKSIKQGNGDRWGLFGSRRGKAKGEVIGSGCD